MVDCVGVLNLSSLQLPYSTDELPGIGGELRATPEHFVVEEVPLYEPQDEGEHLFVNLTKVGLTTRDVQQQLARLFALTPGDIGYAGLKDKQARTTQSFSIFIGRKPASFVDEAAQRIVKQLPVTVNWVRLHKNKLRPGHLLGNRFQITVSALQLPLPEIEQRTLAIAQQLLAQGLPNYFGPQRFGLNGDNVEKGRVLLLGTQRGGEPWLRRLLISGYQSWLCNQYLVRRVEQGGFHQLLAGDVAKKYATGGMFDVIDPAVEQPRYSSHEISFTAPMFGAKMWAAKGDAGALEAQILAEAEITAEHLHKAKIEGTRRLGRLLLTDLQSQVGENTLTLRFFLPKGAFATTVLREFIKGDLPNTPELDEE